MIGLGVEEEKRKEEGERRGFCIVAARVLRSVVSTEKEEGREGGRGRRNEGESELFADFSVWERAGRPRRGRLPGRQAGRASVYGLMMIMFLWCFRAFIWDSSESG